MDRMEKVEMLCTLLGEKHTLELDEKLGVFLDAAGREIIGWRGSYAGETGDDVPAEYEMTQIHAVLAGYSISGAEGQTQHSENGINRSFKYPDMLAYIRSNVIPKVGVL